VARTFKKFQYRGVDLEKLLTMKAGDYTRLLPARLRRRFGRGLRRKQTTLLQKLRKAKKEAKIAPGETTARPPTVKVRLYSERVRARARHSDVAEVGALNSRPPPPPRALVPPPPASRLSHSAQTHLRNMPIVPEMVGSLVAVFSGKVFNVVEIKPEMIGKYLAEFSITYKPTLHGRPGLGATHSSRFIPLK
jgi:small subunit ribosomal protein S15e